MAEQIDHRVAAWMAAVAKALEDLPACKPDYGEFYVSRADISFDGDETGYAIVPNEFGGYCLSVGDPTTPGARS